ncbi:MAG: nucleoside deaminase [Nanoarchaeota archaeon]|nr:nucleoside deaminase [Nanoarchaeota archaeon]MBU1103863.1 nucleoside deaminase [Nanoarchaeota archaeon]
MKDKDFMKEAIEDAKKRRHHFGAVIVKNGKIISKAGKRPVGDSRYHAETEAILKTGKKNLEGCILYSTCEPCPMCFYMAWITGISKIFYGATVQDAIKFGSDEIRIGIKELNKRGGNKIKIKGKFMRDECLELFEKD